MRGNYECSPSLQDWQREALVQQDPCVQFAVAFEAFYKCQSKWHSVNKSAIYHSCTPLSSFLNHLFSA